MKLSSILLLLLVSHPLWSQSEYELLGNTPGQVLYRLGEPRDMTEPSYRNFFIGSLVYQYDGYYLYLEYTKGIITGVEKIYRNKTKKVCQTERDEIIEQLKLDGFKFWRNSEDRIQYWNPKVIANFYIIKSSTNSYFLKVEYCKNTINR